MSLSDATCECVCESDEFDIKVPRGAICESSDD